MNEKIKLLALQVVPMAGEDGEYLPSLHTPEDIERFAELLIRKCVDICISNRHDDSALHIEKHFGVEE